MSWNLRDKDGKFRSRRGFKQDMKNDSQEPWEVRRRENTKKQGKADILSDDPLANLNVWKW